MLCSWFFGIFPVFLALSYPGAGHSLPHNTYTGMCHPTGRDSGTPNLKRDTHILARGFTERAVILQTHESFKISAVIKEWLIN